MLFALLDIFFRILIIVLLIRFFIEKYQFYGYGPVLYGIIEITNKLLMPLRQVIPPASRMLHQYLPLTAIGVIVLIRGLCLWVLGSWHLLYDLTPATGISGLLPSVGLSASMAVLLIAEMLILFLFASMMVSRYGIMACTSAGFQCFQDKTYAIFQWAKKIIKLDDLVTLFLFSSAVILLASGFLSAILNFSFIQGPSWFYATMIVSMFDILRNVVFLYMIVLLLSILSSWVGADNFSLMIQVLKAMTEPYLNIFRRLCPWARIDFIDLSPIFAFILLNPILMYGLTEIQNILLSMIIGAESPTRGLRML